jgi:hypothetical protein
LQSDHYGIVSAHTDLHLLELLEQYPHYDEDMEKAIGSKGPVLPKFQEIIDVVQVFSLKLALYFIRGLFSFKSMHM